jgi:hypothetical protein
MPSIIIWPLSFPPLAVMDVILCNLEINIATALGGGRVVLIIGK